jgi:hypothetical protein
VTTVIKDKPAVKEEITAPPAKEATGAAPEETAAPAATAAPEANPQSTGGDTAGQFKIYSTYRG